jgi:hypothetical protein
MALKHAVSKKFFPRIATFFFGHTAAFELIVCRLLPEGQDVLPVNKCLSEPFALVKP